MELVIDSPESQSGIQVKETLKLELLKTAIEQSQDYNTMSCATNKCRVACYSTCQCAD